MNIFREIIKKLPQKKIEIIPEDPKDEKIAKQISNILTYLAEEEKNEFLLGNGLK